jgi:hypothetical protein
VYQYILISCFASVGLNSQGQPPLPAVVLPPAAIPAPPIPDVKALPRIEIERPVPETPPAPRSANERVETQRVPYRDQELQATVVMVPGTSTGPIEMVVYNLSKEHVTLTIGDQSIHLPKRSRQTLPITGLVSWSLGSEKSKTFQVPDGTAGVEIYLDR